MEAPHPNTPPQDLIPQEHTSKKRDTAQKSQFTAMQATPPPLLSLNTPQLTTIPQHTPLHNHLSSPLLRLPGELRNKIYVYILSHHHPIRVCFLTSSLTRRTRGARPCRAGSASHMHYPRRFLTALTQVCRQMYHEARGLPFARNLFFGYAEALLAAVPGRLCAWQLCSVTKVELAVQVEDVTGGYERDAWRERRRRGETLEGALGVVCRLPALRQLRVVWEGGYLDEHVWGRFVQRVKGRVESLRGGLG